MTREYGLKTFKIWLPALILVWLFEFTLADQVHPYLFTILLYAGINIILAVSLNLVNGFTGQFSMGHAGFMAIGGYVAAFLSITFELPFPLSLLSGGFAASFAGLLVGLPSLRLRGDYLAIVTLGFGEIIRVIILNIEAVGAARGLPNIPKSTTFGWVYTGVLVTVFSVWRIIGSRHGRAFLAVREDEIAAEAMGVNTTRAKVRAFIIGAFFAGIAGGLFAHHLQYLNPQTFDFNRSFEIISMVVLGGMGSITGSVLAALFLTGLREALRPLQEITRVDFRMVIYSLTLIVLMLTRPNGLLGTREFPDFLPRSLRRKLLGKKVSA